MYLQLNLIYTLCYIIFDISLCVYKCNMWYIVCLQRKTWLRKSSVWSVSFSICLLGCLTGSVLATGDIALNQAQDPCPAGAVVKTYFQRGIFQIRWYLIKEGKVPYSSRRVTLSGNWDINHWRQGFSFGFCSLLYPRSPK